MSRRGRCGSCGRNHKSSGMNMQKLMKNDCLSQKMGDKNT